MNQNRNQNRRRGRGSNRGQGGGNQGNRIDSRARGNAPQLLEKYKKLAHDASLNGDRVQTEYYLQFADHYFRVVADSRAQREEQQQQRSRRDQEHGGEREQSFDDGDYDDDQDETDRRPHRGSARDERSAPEGEPGVEGDEIAAEAEDNPFTRDARGPRPRQRGRRRPTEESGEAEAEVGFDAATLPPAIGREEQGGEAQPRRTRTRRPRPADDDGEEALEAVS